MGFHGIVLSRLKKTNFLVCPWKSISLPEIARFALVKAEPMDITDRSRFCYEMREWIYQTVKSKKGNGLQSYSQYAYFDESRDQFYNVESPGSRIANYCISARFELYQVLG